MMMEASPIMSDNARVWVYQAGRTLTAAEAKELQELGAQFVAAWASHGTDLKSSFELRHQRFAILSVDEAIKDASGCSIDTSVHFMQDMEQRFGTSFFDRMTLCYQTGDEIRDCRLNEIPSLITDGSLTAETLVFDNLVQTREELAQKWMVPLSETWTSRYLS